MTVSFGAPLPSNTQRAGGAPGDPGTRRRRHGAPQASGAICWTAASSASARRNWTQFAMADSTGRELTYGEVLDRRRAAGGLASAPVAESEMVGVLLPPTVAGALVNVGAHAARQVPVNLNFTAGRKPWQSAIEQCGIRTVITSRAFLAKAQARATARARSTSKTSSSAPPRSPSCAPGWPRVSCPPLAVARTPHARFARHRHLLQRHPPAFPRASCSRTTT